MKLSSAQRTSLTKSNGVIRALATERLEVVTKELDGLKSAENLTKQQVRDSLSTVFSNLYAVDSDLTALAKSLQDEGLIPGDFDFVKARGFASDDDAATKEKADKAAADAKTKADEEAAAKAKADKEAADKEAADKAKTDKTKGVPTNIAPDLLTAIETVTPLLQKASEQESAPSADLDRVSAFLGKVAATKGLVTKGLTADHVEKGFKHMTSARVDELKAAHTSLGNLLEIFTTGKAADDGEDDASKKKTNKGASSSDSDNSALVDTLKSIQTAMGTMSDRLETIEHTRKSASGDGPESTDGTKVDTKKGAVDWGGIL